MLRMATARSNNKVGAESAQHFRVAQGEVPCDMPCLHGGGTFAARKKPGTHNLVCDGRCPPATHSPSCPPC